MQWLKLHEKNPSYAALVDKYEVKAFVRQALGEEHVVPAYGVYDCFDDIDFESLPQQFVLKCTHNSGGEVLVRDKKKLDLAAARQKINTCLKVNYYYTGREYPYKNVKPRILAEKLLLPADGSEPRDYKVHVFNGKAAFIQVDSDRHSGAHVKNFYTPDWSYIPVSNGVPSDPALPAPDLPCTDELLALSEKLTEAVGNPPVLRTDFYVVDGQIYFGEITFFHGSGFDPFDPPEYDRKFGDMIRLR